MKLNERQKVVVKALCEYEKVESIPSRAIENLVRSLITVLQREKAKGVSKDGIIEGAK